MLESSAQIKAPSLDWQAANPCFILLQHKLYTYVYIDTVEWVDMSMEASGSFPSFLLKKSMISDCDWGYRGGCRSWRREEQMRNRWVMDWIFQGNIEWDAWQDRNPFEVCNHKFRVSPVSSFMAFLNSLSVFQVRARNIFRDAFNHVKILLEGRLLNIFLEFWNWNKLFRSFFFLLLLGEKVFQNIYLEAE